MQNRFLLWLFVFFRCLYGAYFLYAITILLYLIDAGESLGVRFDYYPEETIAFMVALGNTGFVYPLLVLNYLVGGGLLMLDRTAPAGIILLAPPAIVIFFFHAMMGGSMIWGAFTLGSLLVLAWCYRARYYGLLGINARTEALD